MRVESDKKGRKHFFFSYAEAERLREAKVICAIRGKLGIPIEWYRSIEFITVVTSSLRNSRSSEKGPGEYPKNK